MSRKRIERTAPTFMNAAEAAARLGIRRASLYAYVSRGAIRVAAHPSDPRARLYAAADVETLLQRKARGRRPAVAAATALSWGLPVLETKISRIAGGRLTYRGKDAIALAETATLEDVARLLWACGDDDPFTVRIARRDTVGKGTAIDRAITMLAASLPNEQSADTHAITHAAAIVRDVATSVAGKSLSAVPLHQALAQAWKRREAADTIRRALVLCADHELNASAFAARVVASTGASLMACVIAGLAALSGPRHGGATEQVAALFDACTGRRDPAGVIRRKGRAAIVGFGHPLYPEGDPRAAALLAAFPALPSLAAVMSAATDATGQKPTIDVALVVFERSAGLPKGAALAIFALGRTVGWLAHAMEQRELGQLIRPRANYIGEAS